MSDPRAQTLLKLADEIAPPIDTLAPDSEWYDAIRNEDPNVLVELISMMDSGKAPSASKRKALREAAIAEVERQSAHAIVRTMTNLDEATNALNKRMYVLAIAGVVLAIAQIVVAVIQSSDFGKSSASKAAEAPREGRAHAVDTRH